MCGEIYAKASYPIALIWFRIHRPFCNESFCKNWRIILVWVSLANERKIDKNLNPIRIKSESLFHFPFAGSVYWHFLATEHWNVERTFHFIIEWKHCPRENLLVISFSIQYVNTSNLNVWSVPWCVSFRGLWILRKFELLYVVCCEFVEEPNIESSSAEFADKRSIKWWRYSWIWNSRQRIIEHASN